MKAGKALGVNTMSAISNGRGLKPVWAEFSTLR